MLRIRPFPAIRPQPNLAARIASVPYDVVTTNEARRLAADNPISFLHVVRPEIDLPPDTDPHDDAVYAKGRENLDRLLADRSLVRDTVPRIFLYRQVLRHRSQVGIVCCCHVDDYLTNKIKKHEHTRPDKEDDRTRHVLAMNANTGPVFLTYRDREEVDALVRRDCISRPLYHFDAPDAVTHTVWTVDDHSDYVTAFEQVPFAYVADGHHRSASAARAGAILRKKNPDHRGDEEYNWFLSVLFPSSRLTILPYHRLVLDLGGRSHDSVLEALRAAGELTETTDPEPGGPGAFCIFLRDRWLRLDLDPTTIDRSDPVASLDVALLEKRVLEPVFGIGDVRTDPRIDFVGGIGGTAELERRVRGGAAAAISMRATTIEQLMEVADAGLVMPPKSTWFEPKLRSGLFVHGLDEPSR